MGGWRYFVSFISMELFGFRNPPGCVQYVTLSGVDGSTEYSHWYRSRISDLRACHSSTLRSRGSRQLVLRPCGTADIPLILTPWRIILGSHQRQQGNTQALFLPEVAQVRNPRLLQALYKRIRQLGGKIIEHCEVQELEISGQKVHAIRTPSEKHSADQYILSAGAWSRKILGEHALNLAIKPIRGQMLLYRLPGNPLCSIVLQRDLYLIPRRDGHLLVGSTIEDTGFDKQITLDAKNRLSSWAEEILPQLKNTPLLKHWSGLRPATPDNIPIIGPHPFLENLYINSGHFRYGVTMAPGSAEILVNEILKRTQPFDVTPYQRGWHPSE